jgi:hypothetical protein
VTQKALARIEAMLEEICEQQGEIRRRLARLESGMETPGRASSGEVLRFLDQFRAGEALGEASTGAWIEASPTECLRGGLRTVQMREGMHARLLEQRIKELGGSPSYEVPTEVREQAMKQAGDRKKSDGDKLLEFVQRFPDPEKAVQPILDFADRLDHDPETQSLLRTIAQDERSSLQFLNDACAILNA